MYRYSAIGFNIIWFIDNKDDNFKTVFSVHIFWILVFCWLFVSCVFCIWAHVSADFVCLGVRQRFCLIFFYTCHTDWLIDDNADACIDALRYDRRTGRCAVSHCDNDDEKHKDSRPTEDIGSQPTSLVDHSLQYGTFAQSTGWWWVEYSLVIFGFRPSIRLWHSHRWVGGTTGSASDQQSEGCGFEAY